MACPEGVSAQHPPKHGKPLSLEQINLLIRWVEEGAEWREHWAFRPPESPDPPGIERSNWPAQPIDTFLLAGMEQAGLQPVPDPDAATLLRRVTFNLTGLPPTPEEVDAFLADASPQAYHRVVVLYVSNPPGPSMTARRQVIDAMQELNRKVLSALADPAIATHIDSYELAFRMQTSVPELMDISKEPRETLVIWVGEFGRTAYSQGQIQKDNFGRDHHPRWFSIWMAGGGVKPGLVLGETDEFGYNIVRDPVDVHDLHATILHLLGIDHKQFTYRFEGRDYRLTDISGKLLQPLLA